MKRKRVTLLLALLAFTLTALAETTAPIKRILFFGDSQTGWMGERLGAWGQANGFDVVTVTWDGATPQKWAATGKIPSYIAKYHPDMVMINLGMNELLERNPAKNLGPSMSTIIKAIGDRPFVWIGPLEWPGKGKGEVLVNYLQKTVDATGNGHFFNASGQKIPRQSRTNPHPTQAGAYTLMDHVMQWLPSTGIHFPHEPLVAPASGKGHRGPNFIYKRQNQRP